MEASSEDNEAEESADEGRSLASQNATKNYTEKARPRRFTNTGIPPIQGSVPNAW